MSVFDNGLLNTFKFNCLHDVCKYITSLFKMLNNIDNLNAKYFTHMKIIQLYKNLKNINVLNNIYS